jgi:putative ABC transport system ATP-binding protein
MLEVVSAQAVWKSHVDEKYVLKGIDLAVNEGSFVMIMGRSGAGKTTLLKIMGLLERPTKGEVKIFGMNASNLNDDQKARIRLEGLGFVFQSLNLIPHLTAVENIEVPMWLKKVEPRERRRRATELLERFNLIHLKERLPSQMSLGEQQRVAVLRAVANGPKLILADEPAAHLDDESASQLYGLLKELNKSAKTSILATTTSEEEASVADSRFLLSHGVLTKV